MGKDNRPWRKQMKKLQRSKRRKSKAGIVISQEVKSSSSASLANKNDTEESKNDLSSEGSESESDILERLQHEALEVAYLEREKQAQLEFQRKNAAKERRRRAKEEERVKIKKEWEIMREKDRILMEEKRLRDEIDKREKEERFNELLEFLSGDIENPPQRYLMPEIVDGTGEEPCLYYSRTAACRFFDGCKKPHMQPTLSCILLIPNFFSHFYIQQGLSNNENLTDLTLEYEESDVYKEFLQFYNDVLPEFQSIGNVVQFKVCCNFEPHMRGNVYIQYDTIKEAVQAYRVFNARFYGGKQLSVQFVKISSWKGAICSQFLRHRCEKGKTCNYIHPFRNPTREFVLADNDWPDVQTKHRSKHKYEKKDRSSRSHHKADKDRTVALENCRQEKLLESSDANSTTSDPDKSTPESSPAHSKARNNKRSTATKTSQDEKESITRKERLTDVSAGHSRKSRSRSTHHNYSDADQGRSSSRHRSYHEKSNSKERHERAGSRSHRRYHDSTKERDHLKRHHSQVDKDTNESFKRFESHLTQKERKKHRNRSSHDHVSSSSHKDVKSGHKKSKKSRSRSKTRSRSRHKHRERQVSKN